MSAHELWLRVPRNVIAERGFGVTHLPRDRAAYLTGTGWTIDPLSGYLCPRVKADLTGSLAFADVTSDYSACAPFMVSDGTYPAALSHTAAAAFTLTTADEITAGRGLVLGFVAYGAGKAFTVEFGGRYALTLDNGTAELKGIGADAPTLAFAELYDADEWQMRPHLLYLYCQGDLVCVRRFYQQRQRGLFYREPSPVGGYALLAGKVTVKGEGPLTFAVAPERHELTFTATHSAISLPERTTTTVQSWLNWLPTPMTTAPVDGSTNNPTLTVDAGGSPHTDFTYTITATLDTDHGPNLYVTRARIWFPQLKVDDGADQVNLLATAGIGVDHIEDRRSLDPRSCGLTFHLKALPGYVSPYVQPNMRGQWYPFGTMRSDFYTTEPELELTNHHEVLSFGCETGWKRLDKALWSGENSYGGRLLAEVYRDVAQRGGLDSSEIVIYSGGYALPDESQDGPPLFDFRPGQSVADILLYLRDHFAATDLVRFRDDGLFYAEPRPTAASGVVWQWTTDPEDVINVAYGTSTVPRILRGSWRERINEDGFANEVWIVGADKDGQPLVAWATDWPSINDPTALNYVGEFRRMVIVDGGLTTQGLVNWVCCQVYERVRQLRHFVSFKGLYCAELLEGDLIEVDGRGVWRILTMNSTWSLSGPQGLAVYEAERP